MIFVQSRDDDHVLRACTTNNEQRPDNGNPTFPNVALAPQIWFRHTTFLTSKLSQIPNHATSGPQVSFAVVTWCLGIASRVSNFANTISMRSRKGHPKLENVLEVSFLLQHPALIQNTTLTKNVVMSTFGSQNRPIKIPPTYFRLDAPLLEILPSGDIPSMSTSAIMPFHNVDSKLLH